MTDRAAEEALQAMAIEWVVRMHSDQVTHEDEHRFAAWLEQNPAHPQAYANQTALWRGIGELARGDQVREALAALRDEPAHAGRRRFLGGGIAAGIAVTGAGWTAWQWLERTQSFVTQSGEQRRQTLADGSIITLDTDSALRVEFQAGERRLWLDRGRAYFAVAKDATRPFRVFVGTDEVRALGTEFDIRRDSAHARVTLEEGRVAIFRTGDQPLSPARATRIKPAAVLQPGQQAILTPTIATPEIRGVALGVASAWRSGDIVLDNEPLVEAVAEINRYNARKVILADDGIASIPLNGVFQLGHPETFVDVLTTTFPVRIARQDEDAIYLTGIPRAEQTVKNP